MRFSGSHAVPVERQRLWDAFHDTDLVRRALPGCTALEGHEPGHYTANVSVGIACVAGSYHADLTVTDRDVPASFTVEGAVVGEPGAGRGRVTLDLEDEGDTSTVRFDLDAEVTGAVSRVGRRLLESAIQRTIADHLDAVAAEISGDTTVAAVETPGPGVAPPQSAEGPPGEPAVDAGAEAEAPTVTFAPARLRGDQLVTVVVAAAAAVVAYLLGRRSRR